MIGTAYGSVLVGLHPHRVKILAAPGTFRVKGLSEAAERETRVRVQSALGGPVDHAITIQDLPEHVSTACLDLAILVAIKRARGEHVSIPANATIVGELALDGRVRATRGVLCHLANHPIVVPLESAWEAGLAAHRDVFSIAHVSDLSGDLPRVETSHLPEHVPHGLEDLTPALRATYTQCTEHARVLLVSRPGSGMTMLARTIATAVRGLDAGDQINVLRVLSAAGILCSGQTTRRTFRAPHHSVSEAGLIGGGQVVRPGEVSLAHAGVLFLDELPEFRLGALTALAHALNEGKNLGFPACPLMVIGTAAPCPCGYAGTDRCHCPEKSVVGYRARLDKFSKLLGMAVVEVSS